MNKLFSTLLAIAPAFFLATLLFAWLPFKIEIFTEYPVLCDPYSNPHYSKSIALKKKAKTTTPTKSPPKKIAKKTTKPIK